MKRILVPIDFSDTTPRVIDLARQLAKALDAELHLVHVRELAAAATPRTLGYGLEFRTAKIRSRSWRDGKKKSHRTASRSSCTSRPER